MTRGQEPALVVTLLLASFLVGARPIAAASLDARMVAEQVEARGIEDARVLDALRRVPRAAFVPPGVRWRAHDDEPLPIGSGQTISQPYVVALMTTLLDIGADHKVLEIGTGSGYQAAVLSFLARQVYTVEIIPELATGARLRLTRQGLWNVHVKQGDGNFGWQDYAPYDRIMVTAAAAKIPEALVEQLAEGGVLVMPVGAPDGIQMLVRGVKRGGKLHAHPVRKVRFVPLTGDVGGPTRTPSPRQVPAPPHPDVNEEDLSSQRRIDTRALLGGRSRAAHARDSRGDGHPCESVAAARAAARCAQEVG